MKPVALANVFYPEGDLFAPPAFVDQTGSNVIPVDFVQKAMLQPVHPSPKAVGGMEWRIIATERLSALHRLSDGWDGAGSLPVSDVALTKADRILSFAFQGIEFAAPPAAVPCGDGSLQLEWWLTDTRFELCIEPDGSLEGWALDRDNGHEVSVNGTEAIELLAKWSGRLTADKLARPA